MRCRCTRGVKAVHHVPLKGRYVSGTAGRAPQESVLGESGHAGGGGCVGVVWCKEAVVRRGNGRVWSDRVTWGVVTRPLSYSFFFSFNLFVYLSAYLSLARCVASLSTLFPFLFVPSRMPFSIYITIRWSIQAVTSRHIAAQGKRIEGSFW